MDITKNFTVVYNLNSVTNISLYIYIYYNYILLKRLNGNW